MGPESNAARQKWRAISLSHPGNDLLCGEWNVQLYALAHSMWLQIMKTTISDMFLELLCFV